MRQNTSGGSDQGPIPRAEAGRRRLVAYDAAALDDRDPGHEAVGEIQIVRRQNDDRAVGGERLEPRAHHADGCVVETGKRLVEQHQPRIVQQRPLEREALPHAAGKPVDGVVRTIRETGTLECGIDDGDRIQTIQLGEELQVLASGEFRVEVQFVSEKADSPTQPPRRGWSRGSFPNRTSPEVGAASVARMPISVDLPAPFGPSRPRMSPARAVSVTCESARRRPVVSRNIVQSNGIEVGVGHAQGAPSAPSGAASGAEIPARSACGTAAS